MHYLAAYRFPFSNPRWLQILLIGLLCNFVPVVGQIVLAGFLLENIELMHRYRKESLQDFDFNRLVIYLTRGLWPFLVQLLVTLPVTAVYVVIYFAAVFFPFMTSAFSGQAPNMGWFFFGTMLASLLLNLVMIPLALVLVPMCLRAGLAQDFKEGFSLAFVRDFLGRVWMEVLLAQLFLFVTGIVVTMVGFAAFCIGVYPAMVILMFAQYHLWHQLYELYLQRGGTPIPLKPEA
jgi:hypothetical protein